MLLENWISVESPNEIQSLLIALHRYALQLSHFHIHMISEYSKIVYLAPRSITDSDSLVRNYLKSLVVLHFSEFRIEKSQKNK